MPDQPTSAPTRKVSAATLGGAAAAIGAWLIQLGFGIDVPPGVEGGIATLAAFGFGYIVRES